MTGGWARRGAVQPLLRCGAGRLAEAVATVELQLAHDQVVGIVGRLDPEPPEEQMAELRALREQLAARPTLQISTFVTRSRWSSGALTLFF